MAQIPVLLSACLVPSLPPRLCKHGHSFVRFDRYLASIAQAMAESKWKRQTAESLAATVAY
jgi:hypothetical protein